jgi:hypothetical protein
MWRFPLPDHKRIVLRGAAGHRVGPARDALFPSTTGLRAGLPSRALEPEREAGALARLAPDGEIAAHHARELAADGEAEARAAGLTGESPMRAGYQTCAELP